MKQPACSSPWRRCPRRRGGRGSRKDRPGQRLRAHRLTAISASKTFGAKRVFACDLIDEKLAVAREMGADEVFNSGRCDLPAEIKARTDGIGVDVAIDITGAAAAINTGLKCVRAAGRMVCVGLPSKPVTLEDMADDLIYREVQLTGVSGRKIWETWRTLPRWCRAPGTRWTGSSAALALEDYEKALEQIRAGVPGKMILYP